MVNVCLCLPFRSERESEKVEVKNVKFFLLLLISVLWFGGKLDFFSRRDWEIISGFFASYNCESVDKFLDCWEGLGTSQKPPSKPYHIQQIYTCDDINHRKANRSTHHRCWQKSSIFCLCDCGVETWVYKIINKLSII